MLTTGQIVTNDDSFTGTVDVDNIVRELLALVGAHAPAGIYRSNKKDVKACQL